MLIVLSAIAGLFGVTLIVIDEDQDGRPERIEVIVNTRPDDPPAQAVGAPAPVVEGAAEGLERDLQTSPVPVDPTPRELQTAHEVGKSLVELPTAGAVQGFRGCRTRILPVNFSQRNGAKPAWQVLHYTVSRNVAGWADVNAIVNLFSNPGRQASSNFVIDSEGNCAYIVPIEHKAWTQAAGNPWSISYEIIAWGDEPRYLEPAGLAKLKSVMRQVARRTRIPLRRGAVSGSCTPVRAGVVHHYDFGNCGGGHHDITPFSIAGVLKYVQAGPLLTAKQRRVVAGMRVPKGTGHSRAYWCERAKTAVLKPRRYPRRAALVARVARARCR